jgi:GT2 family glycosyltransferase
VDACGGLFDEAFPIYFNDVDLCWRLRRQGWELWYLPTSRVLHHGGASTRQVRPAMIAASHAGLARFYEKHYRALLAPPVYRATRMLIVLSGAWRLWRSRRASRQSQQR